MQYDLLSMLEANGLRSDRHLTSRLRRLLSLLLTSLLLCCAATAVVVRRHNLHAPKPTAVVEQPTTDVRVRPSLTYSAALAQAPPLRLGVIPVTLRPRGFEPAEVSRPAGRILLAVYNRSGLAEVALRLDPEVGLRLRDVRVPRQQLNWRTPVELIPGRYLLTEANHPEWVCRITITAP